MRRNTIHFTLSVLIAFFYCLLGEESLQAEETHEKYRIAAILPLSGSNASLGRYVKNGLDLAISNLPQHLRASIELTYEDDQLQSTKAVTAYQRLRAKGIDAVFVLGSGIGNAIAPLAERDQILLVAIGASDGNIVKGRKYSFLHWVTPEVEAVAMSEEMKSRGYKNIGIVTTEQEGAYAVMRAVKQALQDQNLADRIVVEEAFLPAETDFKSYIARARSHQVDVIIVLLFPGPLASFAKQTRAMNLGADLAGVELFEDEHEVKASDGALIGQWYVNADVATSTFQDLYRGRFNEQPGWGVANAYDTLNLVAEAAQKFGRDNDKVAAHLFSLKEYSGAAGVYSASGDNRFNLPATIKVVRESGFEKLY